MPQITLINDHNCNFQPRPEGDAEGGESEGGRPQHGHAGAHRRGRDLRQEGGDHGHEGGGEEDDLLPQSLHAGAGAARH